MMKIPLRGLSNILIFFTSDKHTIRTDHFPTIKDNYDTAWNYVNKTDLSYGLQAEVLELKETLIKITSQYGKTLSEYQEIQKKIQDEEEKKQKELQDIKKGDSSSISIENCSISYNHAEITIKADRIQNDSPWRTGKLKIIFWLSTAGEYHGGNLEGIEMASTNLDALDEDYGYPNIEYTLNITENPSSGTYNPVITINEKHEDGNWYIVGYSNFRVIKW